MLLSMFIVSYNRWREALCFAAGRVLYNRHSRLPFPLAYMTSNELCPKCLHLHPFLIALPINLNLFKLFCKYCTLRRRILSLSISKYEQKIILVFRKFLSCTSCAVNQLPGHEANQLFCILGYFRLPEANIDQWINTFSHLQNPLPANLAVLHNLFKIMH